MMKNMWCLAIGLFLAQFSLCALSAPQTLRIDYFHTGSADSEIFSLDQVVLEPLPFPGNLQQPIDYTVRGKYLFEVVDPGSGEVAWSRSFSSIYGEWETTAEARKMHRTFHESLRLPNQEKPFEIVLRKRGEQNRFDEVWRIEIDPNDDRHIYVLGTYMHRSRDGGRTFTQIEFDAPGTYGVGVHVDNHALWIDPADSDRDGAARTRARVGRDPRDAA